MLTDRAPFDYIYMSKRLLTDLFDQDAGTRTRWRGDGKVRLSILEFGWRRRPIDRENVRELAMQSVGFVSDHTGRIGTSNTYVRDEIDFRGGVFAPLMGWPGGKIACYQGVTTTPDGGRAFVALFGSASNVVGRRPTADDIEYYPSDATGLYALLDAVREAGDPEIDLSCRFDDHGFSTADRTEIAVRFALRGVNGSPQRLDFLARVFLDEEKCVVDGTVYDRVVIGTPLWVSTPKPKAEATWEADRG